MTESNTIIYPEGTPVLFYEPNAVNPTKGVVTSESEPDINQYVVKTKTNRVFTLAASQLSLDLSVMHDLLEIQQLYKLESRNAAVREEALSCTPLTIHTGGDKITFESVEDVYLYKDESIGLPVNLRSFVPIWLDADGAALLDKEDFECAKYPVTLYKLVRAVDKLH